MATTMAVEEKILGSKAVLNISTRDLTGEPFPHVTKQEFIQADLYRRLKAEFPSDDMSLAIHRWADARGATFTGGMRFMTNF